MHFPSASATAPCGLAMWRRCSVASMIRLPRMRFMGEDAIGLAVSMKPGGDILVLGKALSAEFARIQETLPLGMQLRQVADQPAAVRAGVGEFVRVLAEAVAIVLLVSFFSRVCAPAWWWPCRFRWCWR